MRLSIRREVVRGIGIAQRILYASDLHLNPINGTAPAAALCHAARSLTPDHIVLGGDLADARGYLGSLRRMIHLLCKMAPVHVLPGNHDLWPGIDCIRREVLTAGGTWHPSGAIVFARGKSSWDLQPDTSHRTTEHALVCVHDPAHLASLQPGWRIGIAGHLHGGQVVLWKYRDREFPGAWISRWNGPRFDEEFRTILVSRGIADTLPIRWNCPREIILCETQ